MQALPSIGSHLDAPTLKMIVAATVLALLFRAACVGSRRFSLQLISGIWLGIAAWILGALALAWVPLWQMLLLGLLLAAGTTTVRAKLSMNVQPAADFIAIAAMALLSVIPEQTGLILLAAVAFAAAGFLMDVLTRRMRPRFQHALVAMPVVLIALLAVQVRQPGNFGWRLLEEDPFFPLRLVLVAPSSGARLPLEDGTAAWLLKTPHPQPVGTAIVMHGNHQNGSEQPSSVALQGALVRAGYDVLSVDHPGFGSSRVPHASADWREWDPARGPSSALKYLQRAASATDDDRGRSLDGRGRRPEIRRGWRAGAGDLSVRRIARPPVWRPMDERLPSKPQPALLRAFAHDASDPG